MSSPAHSFAGSVIPSMVSRGAIGCFLWSADKLRWNDHLREAASGSGPVSDGHSQLVFPLWLPMFLLGEALPSWMEPHCFGFGWKLGTGPRNLSSCCCADLLDDAHYFAIAGVKGGIQLTLFEPRLACIMFVSTPIILKFATQL